MPVRGMEGGSTVHRDLDTGNPTAHVGGRAFDRDEVPGGDARVRRRLGDGGGRRGGVGRLRRQRPARWQASSGRRPCRPGGWRWPDASAGLPVGRPTPSWLLSRPQAHWIVPAENTSAPLAARYMVRWWVVVPATTLLRPPKSVRYSGVGPVVVDIRMRPAGRLPLSTSSLDS